MSRKTSPAGDTYENEADSTSSSAAVRQAPAASGSGRPLPAELQSSLGSSLGVDFSQVRVFEGPHVSSINAVAFTRGAEIHFAPGEYRPGTTAGRELLAHEAWHVVQQQQGRVKIASGLAQVTEKR